MKKRKKRFKIFKLIMYIILFFLVYSIGVGTYENIRKHQLINDFKSRAYESITLTHYDTEHVYHKVKRKHDYELADTRGVFYDAEKLNPGVSGDILLAFESPFPQIPIASHLINFYIGGHAALVTENNQLIESTGMAANGLLDINKIIDVILHNGYDEGNTFGVAAQKVNNYWFKPMRNENQAEYKYFNKFYRNEMIAVRPKYNSLDDIKDVTDFALDKVGKATYNYLFIFDTQYKYFCTDLVTRSFEHVNESKGTKYNLNQDSFIPTDYDILLSNDVFMTMFRETINGVVHIYYLEDI